MALPVTENPPICCFWFTGEQAWWLILFVILFPSPLFILFAATFEAIAIAFYFITSDLPAAFFAEVCDLLLKNNPSILEKISGIRTGRVAKGFPADLVLWEENLRPVRTWVAGECVYEAPG